MKKTLLALSAFSAMSLTAVAQQWVFEPRAGAQFNQMLLRSADGIQTPYGPGISPVYGIRIYHQNRYGHGPYFLNTIATPRFNGRDGTDRYSIQATIRRYELGYQWTSRPLPFSRLFNSRNAETGKHGWSVQMQPNLGVVMLQSLNNYSITGTASTSKTSVTNWSPAASAGMQFLFSRNNKLPLVLGVNYTRSFAPLMYYDLRSGQRFSTRGSGWSITLGCPALSLRKRR